MDKIEITQMGKIGKIKLNDTTLSNVVDYQITIDRNKPLLSMVIDLSMVDFSFKNKAVEPI